jgi:DNA polymerase I
MIMEPETYSMIESLIDRSADYNVVGDNEYTLDLETDGLLPQVSVIFCAVVRHINTGTVQSFVGDDVYNGKLVEYLHDKTLVMHNGVSYDNIVMDKLLNYSHPLHLCIDTLILSQIHSPNREGGHSLAAWGRRLKFPKSPSPDFTHYTPYMLEYCKNDCELTAKLYIHLLELLKKFSPESIRREHMFRYLIDIQIIHGFYFNIPKASIMLAQLTDKLAKITQDMQEIFPPTKVEMKTKTKYVPFNPGSRQQIATRLMAKGWKPTEYTQPSKAHPKGQVQVSETILKKLSHIPEAAILIDYFVTEKIISFLNNWLGAVDHHTSMIHGDVRTLGAITHRCTHNTPNVAQTPSNDSPYGTECRGLWGVSDPADRRLLGCDASGLELRMLAHYMKDEEYIDLILNGDIHTYNQNAAGLPTRTNAKAFMYALIYGAGDYKIGTIIEKGGKEGKALKEKFLSEVPALGNLIRRVGDAAKRNGKLKALDGRYLIVRSPHAALNVLLQGGGAIVCKEWLIQIMKEVTNLGLDAIPVANIHDEIQFDVHKDHVQELGRITKDAMKRVEAMFNMQCPLDSEWKVGLNWSQTH